MNWAATMITVTIPSWLCILTGVIILINIILDILNMKNNLELTKLRKENLELMKLWDKIKLENKEQSNGG